MSVRFSNLLISDLWRLYGEDPEPTEPDQNSQKSVHSTIDKIGICQGEKGSGPFMSGIKVELLILFSDPSLGGVRQHTKQHLGSWR